MQHKDQDMAHSNSASRAVVVNDDASQANLLCGLLEKVGVKPVPFQNAYTALAAMRQDIPPALIITDLYMPGIDGWRFCRLLRSPEYEHLNRTPVLVVSATFAGDEPARIASELGANAFLSMPVEGQQFIELVQALLKGEKPQAIPKVLLVEDDAAFSTRLARVFEAHGYQVAAAATLQAGLALARQAVYEVAMLDYHLPDGLGEVLLQDLQQQIPACLAIMMTADPQPELALRWMKMGAAAYLHKPFEPEYLLAQCERTRRERALLRIQDLLELRTHQLRKSEERYRHLVESTDGMIFSVDREGTFVTAGGTRLGQFGLKPEDVVGRSLYDLFPKDKARYYREKHLQVFNSGEAICYEQTFQFAGITKTDLTTVYPIKDKSGAVELVGVICRDITDSIAAEQALRESEARFRATVEQSFDGIVIVDPEFRIIEWNAAQTRLFGFSRAEMIGKTLWEYQFATLPAEQQTAQALAALKERLLAARDRHDSTQLGPLHTMEIQHKDGSRKTVQVSSFTIEDPAGRLYCSITRDISAEQSAEQNYQMLFREMLDGFALHEIILDGEGKPVNYRFLSINPAFERLTGLREADTIGRTVLEVLPETEQYWIETYGRVALTGIPAHFENYHHELDKYYEVKAFRPAPNQFACIFADITERKHAELNFKAAYEKLQALWSVTSLKQADVKTISDHILATIARMTGSAYGFYGFINEDESVMTIHSWSGEAMKDCTMVDKPQHFPISAAGVWAEAIRCREPFLLNNYAASHPAKKGLPGGHVLLQNLLVVPYFSRGKIIAVAAVANRAAAYNQEDITQITSFLGSVHAIVDSKRAEEALRDSEEKFRSIAENSFDLIALLDLGGHYRFCSNSYRSILGYDPRELVGQSGFDLIHPDERGEFVQLLEEALADGQARQHLSDQRFSIRIRCRDGSYKNVEHRFRFLLDERGGAEQILLNAQDVTERVQAEEALRQSEERFRRLAEDMPSCICSFLPDSTMTYANPALAALTGLSAEELAGRKFFDLLEPQERELVQKALEALTPGNPTESHEQVHIAPDRSKHYQEWHNRAFFDENGKVHHLQALGFDITERKRTEEALRDSKERLRSLFENVPIGMFQSTPEGKFVYANPAISTMLGYASPEELIQVVNRSSIAEALYEDPARHPLFLQEVEQDQNSWKLFENRYRRKDGRGIDAILSVGERADPVSGQRFLYGFVQDVSERKRAEQALTHSHDLMRYIIEHNRSAIAVHDKDLRYIYVSQRYLDDYKVKERDVIGKHHYEVFPDLPQKWRQVHQRALAGEILSAEDDPYERADGSVDWTRWECRPWYEADGSIGGIIVYTEVITERKRAELARRENERQLATLIANLPGFVYRCANDWDWTMLFISSGCREVTGYAPEDFLQNKRLAYNDIVHPDYQEPLWQKWQALLQKQEAFEAEYPIIHASGAICWVWERGQGVFSETGQLLYLEGFITDITARKQAEAQLNEQMAELRRWHNITLGREERILELKREVNRLLAEAGKPPRYSSAVEAAHE